MGPFLFPFIWLNVMVSSLAAVGGYGWGERQPNQNGMVNLIGLRDLKKQFLRRLFKVRSIEDGYAVNAFPPSSLVLLRRYSRISNWSEVMPLPSLFFFFVTLRPAI